MQHFTNETVDIHSLPKYEETPLTSLDAKYWKVIVINSIIFLALLGIGLAIFAFFNKTLQTYWTIWVPLYVLFGIFLFFISYLSFKKTGYALREKDVLYKSGVIAQKTIIIPLNRIQHVALNQGALSRIFKLGSLQIHTAGGSSGEMHISGIPIAQAKQLKEALVNRLVHQPQTNAE